MSATASATRSARIHRVGAVLAALVALSAAACAGDDAASTALLDAPVVVTEAPATSSAVLETTSAAPATTAAPTTDTPTTIVAVEPGRVFPGADWELGDLPAEIDRPALDAAVDVAFGAPDAAGRVRSIVIVQGGRIVYERYHPLDGPDSIMESFSVAQSITSAAIGLLVGDGLVDVSERAPIAQWDDPADPRHAITLEHLLHMASGLEYTEQYGPGSQVLGMLRAPVASEFIASFPLEAEPGTFFEYSTGTTAILAGIVYDTIGGTEQGEAYLQERLFEPLGITSIELQRDQAGRWVGGFGGNATTRDFARFGLLYLNDGVWDGERILPEGWVEYSHTPSPSNRQYGAQWWMFRDGAFEARGLFGQVILVSPRNDLVLAVNTTNGGDADTLVNAVWAAFDGA
jgi:CubicO group peptidase (beta-lactamase class C family)